MKILHVCQRKTFSGLELWVFEMLRFQRLNGVDARVIVPEGPLQKKCRDANIPTYSESLYRTVFGQGDFEPDVIHLHGTPEFKAALPALAFGRLRSRKRALVILQFHIWISHRKIDPLHKLQYKLVDEIWCSSSRAQVSLQTMLPIPPEKFRILHYGRDLNKIASGLKARDESRRELGLPQDATVIGTVSRLDRGKGIGELINGSIPLLTTLPDLHLVLIGGVTTDPDAVRFNSELQIQLAELPAELRAKIHLLGNIADSYQYLKAFDVFALPTYRECFSLALIEAQLAERPCLVTDSGGSPELVKEGKTGWLCEPMSIASFRSTLERALADHGRWSSFGKAAASRIRNEFDSNVTLHDTIIGYERILGAGSR